MKIKAINIIEIILGVIFFVTFLFKNDKSADLVWLTILTAFLLSILYFPLGFYTLKSLRDIHIVNRILYGMAFSFSISSIMLYLMKIEVSIILLITLSACFLFLAIFRFITVYLFNNDKILKFDNGIVIRYFILLGIMGYSIMTYSFR